jgi:hypothetical protein
MIFVDYLYERKKKVSILPCYWSFFFISLICYNSMVLVFTLSIDWYLLLDGACFNVYLTHLLFSFLNVVSGVTLTETAGDLAVAAAICSRHVIYDLVHLIYLFQWLWLIFLN